MNWLHVQQPAAAVVAADADAADFFLVAVGLGQPYKGEIVTSAACLALPLPQQQKNTSHSLSSHALTRPQHLAVKSGHLQQAGPRKAGSEAAEVELLVLQLSAALEEQQLQHQMMETLMRMCCRFLSCLTQKGGCS